MARKKASEVEQVIVEDGEGDEEFQGGVEDANELNRYCGCGCGEVVKARFRPGHDAKLKARLLNEASAGSEEAAEALVNLGWGRSSRSGGPRTPARPSGATSRTPASAASTR